MTQTTNPINLRNLTSQVTSLIELLHAFSKILDSEEHSIKKAQAEKLNEISLEKQKLAEKLNTAGLNIDNTLEDEASNLVDFSMSAKFDTLPSNLQVLIKEAINLTVQCHDKNLANGMSIKILSNINQHALDMISGKSQEDVKLYGASGEKTQSAGSKTSLGKA